jgi:CrcB protein
VSGWLQWGGLFVAGGGGACLRHLLAQRVDAALAARLGGGLPHAGILVVNLVGCLAIGALAAGLPAGPWRTIVIVGLLGGFTTYSSFALLTVELAGAGRWGGLGWQIGLHLIGGMLMVVLGAALVGLFVPAR